MFAELNAVTVVEHLCIEDALLDHEGPLGGSVDEVLHFARSVEAYVSGVHGFTTEQAQAVDVAKVGVGEQYIIDG
jgi:hypothetical protein